MKLVKNTAALVLMILVLTSCQSNQDTLFSLKDNQSIGIDFANDLSFSNEFNVYTYRNFFNGGGVAIGDINNDGLTDIYMTANQKKNELYLNKGNWKFEKITESAGVGGSKAWSTGVTMVDINADGLLDIYVCNSGDVMGDNKQNELYINQGDLTFTEEAEAYGLADKGYSTHASFFDYDKDGDLDVYLLNNSYQSIGSFDLRRNERPKRDLLGGDKMLRNDGGTFVDVSEEAGIYGSVIGFGLGVTVGDINNDGWEDLYISNDFFERDYLYINNQDGTFKETLTESINSISGASMGADMADINNDEQPDIFITEMLPSEYERLKSVTTFENWDTYDYSVNNGYYHQFTRNMLQLNNGDETFSEVGRLAGVEASDWSWGALFFDMDNDGLKDLYIANGIYRDLTDQDYLQYISSEEVISSIVVDKEVDYSKLVEIIPSNPVANHAYINKGDLKFEFSDQTGLTTKSFSNGAAYGDLDNDGDLDLVVNNVNMPAFIYENHADSKTQNNYINFSLKGTDENRFGIGARIMVNDGTTTYTIDQQPIRGFQSSMDLKPHIGLASAGPVSVKVKWPDGRISLLEEVVLNQTLEISIEDAHKVDTDNDLAGLDLFTKDSESLDYVHSENRYIDFNKNRLLHHMMSTPGPILTTADFDGDGIEDLYIPGVKDAESSLYMGTEEGFEKNLNFSLENEEEKETIKAIAVDVDKDGDLDLYQGNGGVEFSRFSQTLGDHLYLNDGNGNFSLSTSELPTSTEYFNTGAVAQADIDNDGDQDLFVGERAVNDAYGVPGSGHILINNGSGVFEDKTQEIATELFNLGMITDALFADIDNDGDQDLVIVGEFMGVELFINSNGTFTKAESNPLSDLKGWWYTVKATDVNGDGLLDLVAGNHGLNSRFRASESNPIRLYVKDFDNNGALDPIMSFKAEDGKFYPYDLRHNLIDQMKGLKKKFPNYETFKNADMRVMFDKLTLEQSLKLDATYFKTSLFINQGEAKFTTVELPQLAQFSPIFAIESGDFDKDGDMDLLLGGNLYKVKPEVGRYDASYGVYLENDGSGNFTTTNKGKGFHQNGEIRSIKSINNKIIVSRNSDSLVIYNY
jgi:hypothetical protein